MVSIYEGKLFNEVYEKNNYKILVENSNKICTIFFSSSGLYFPNSEEEFENAFIKEDRYEWNTYRIRKSGKYIWVRDVAKQFYIKGINSKIDSIDKLIDFLRVETEGYSIICIGSSAGGYVATLIGEVLKAKYIFNFSGFFSLEICDKEEWPLIEMYYNNENRRKYYNLRQYITKYSVPIFYFYPAKLADDVRQYELISDLENVISIGFNNNIHGIPFYHFALNKLFDLDYSDLCKKLSRYDNKVISQRHFVIHLMGIKEGMFNLMKFEMERFKKSRYFLRLKK